MDEDAPDLRERCKCTRCDAVVDACVVCKLGFRAAHVITCRGDDGHAHAHCAAGRPRPPQARD